MSPTTINVVIIGGGLGGAKAAEALRAQGFAGSITLISNEADAPYERPPLSKGYLAGRSLFEDAVVHPPQWYAEHDVDLRLSTTATAFDKDEHTVTLSDGTTLPYDKLLLSTGAGPRKLSVPGATADTVLYLRRHDDADAIRATFGAGKRLVIIGAGWIGLEVAAAARDADTEVAIVEMAELPLLGVLGPEIARVFADLHTSHSVQLHLGATLEEITLDDTGRANGVRLADGTLISADAMVVGVGVSPDIALAEAGGLAIDNGVLVDASLRTSDPDIYAVGDIANQAHPSIGVRVRVEHWATALKQPDVAVAAMLGSEDEDRIYSELPYFFSDQYDLGMEYIGHTVRNVEHRVIVRGDLASREFVAFWLDGTNRIKAVMNVNVWDVIDAVKPLILAGTAVEPARLSDPQVAYRELAGAR
ncbi:MAG: 3-phenylpropionate/trans-cinnamate dioxygenase ferredoxin reductase component [Pseudonocardiales bacterium]|nr:3-phenylpropionate/trans-cinnamate dioxygenase ferredoxin reductase component [Pseudonocardiales bacterium]